MQSEELILTVIVLFTAGVVPIFQVVGAATYTLRKHPKDDIQRAGYLHYWTRRYVRYLEVPALLVFLGVLLVSLRLYPGLANRIQGGFLAGVVATRG